MTIIKFLLFPFLLCLSYTCKHPTISQQVSKEDFSEYYYRISHLPMDSMVLTANNILTYKWQRDLDHLDGYKIPTFSGRDLHGKVHDVTYKDKLTLLNFWFISCPPCVEEIPYLNIMQDRYRGKLDVVSICRDEELEIVEFLLKHPVNYTVIPDARDLIENRFKMTWGYPKSILVDSNGIVLAMTRGFLGTDDINFQKIERLITENIKE